MMATMSRSIAGALTIAVGALFVGTTVNAAGVSGAPSLRTAASPVSAAQATPRERGELTHKFVLKWGAHVRDTYGVDIGVWAQRMVPTFVAADAANFRNALRRDTFEGAMAELTGSGHRLSDAQAIDVLAKASSGAATPKPAALRKALGDSWKDLVYTPIYPCRIVDTRNTGDGPIPANGTRNFYGYGSGGFESQGGSANCGTGAATPAALVLNVTAVTPTAAGFATVYSSGSLRPPTSSVNYAAGAIVNNAVTTPLLNYRSGFGRDFTVYTFAQSHYVIDIVGYYSPPAPTALQCRTNVKTLDIQPNAEFYFDHNQEPCPEGFALTGANCHTQGFNEVAWSINGLVWSDTIDRADAVCYGRNITARLIAVEATARCCRVPGY